TATLARVPGRETTKFNELGLRRFQRQTELSQPLHKCFLSAESVRTIFEPQIEHIVEIYLTQQYADRSSLRGSFFARMNLFILQNTCLQPAPNQTDQALISHSMFHEAEHPFVIQAPEEILEVRLQHPLDFSASDPLMKRCQRLVGASSGTSSERARQKVLLVNGRQYLRGTTLKGPV